MAKVTEVELDSGSILVDVKTIVNPICAPLGRDQVISEIINHPDFPAPAFGGKGRGSRQLWARELVVPAVKKIVAEMGAARAAAAQQAAK